MSSRTAFGMVCTLATVFAPVAASAQQPAQPTQPTPEVREWLAEIDKLQAELAPLHQEAMQDTALQQEQEQVRTAVREAMIAEDPANGQRLDRLEQLMTEAQAAQAAGDSAKIAALSSEAQQIAPQVQAAEQQALAKPEVDAQIKAFEESLFAKMVALDPTAQARLDRLNELDRLVREAMGRRGD